MAHKKYEFDDPKAAFAEAEMLIYQTSRSGDTSLSLERLGLKEVPESIGRLKQLQYLFLSHNKIETLPYSIVEIKNLKNSGNC